MRGTRTTAPSAFNPSASASAEGPRLRNPLARSQSRIREVEPLDQNADESAVELGAAGDCRLLEIGDTHAHDARVLAGRDGGAALLPAGREVGHLAEALAGAEHREQLLVLGDAHLAVDQDAEEVAAFSLAHHHVVGGGLL